MYILSFPIFKRSDPLAHTRSLTHTIAHTRIRFFAHTYTRTHAQLHARATNPTSSIFDPSSSILYPIPSNRNWSLTPGNVLRSIHTHTQTHIYANTYKHTYPGFGRIRVNDIFGQIRVNYLSTTKQPQRVCFVAFNYTFINKC